MPEPGDIKILIYDDNRPLAESLMRQLQRFGYRVRVVNDAAEAKTKLEREKFHVIVLETKMPGRDSMGLIETALKKQPERCLVLTGDYPPLDSALGAVRGRVYAYLQKPFDADRLAEVIDRAILDGRVGVDAEERLIAEIGRRLRAARKLRGFTLKDIAEKSGLSQGLISKIELARTAASVSTLLKLSKALDIHIASLFE